MHTDAVAVVAGNWTMVIDNQVLIFAAATKTVQGTQNVILGIIGKLFKNLFSAAMDLIGFPAHLRGVLHHIPGPGIGPARVILIVVITGILTLSHPGAVYIRGITQPFQILHGPRHTNSNSVVISQNTFHVHGELPVITGNIGFQQVKPVAPPAVVNDLFHILIGNIDVWNVIGPPFVVHLYLCGKCLIIGGITLKFVILFLRLGDFVCQPAHYDFLVNGFPGGNGNFTDQAVSRRTHFRTAQPDIHIRHRFHGIQSRGTNHCGACHMTGYQFVTLRARGKGRFDCHGKGNGLRRGVSKFIQRYCCIAISNELLLVDGQIARSKSLILMAGIVFPQAGIFTGGSAGKGNVKDGVLSQCICIVYRAHKAQAGRRMCLQIQCTAAAEQDIGIVIRNHTLVYQQFIQPGKIRIIFRKFFKVKIFNSLHHF